MNILLISSNICRTPFPIYPLGLSMIAAALQKAGHQVNQFDFLQRGQSMAGLAKIIEEHKPGLIGISIRNIDNVNFLNEQRYLDLVKDIISHIRQQTKALIVLGGAGFSIMPEVILNEVGADYGFIGEGEAAIVEFVAGLEQGKYPQQRCRRSSLKLCGDEIPSALYDPEVMGFYLKSGQMAPVQTKRGCTHRCVYCSYPILEGATIRCRDPRAVVDDIQRLVEVYKAKYIFFTDSVFNDDQQHYLTVIQEMDKRGVSIPWTAFFKPEGLDDESVELMKKTGLKAAEIGADAASDTTLKGIGKNFLFKDIIACNDFFWRHGIATAHYFMFGCPGETEETVREGIENIIALPKTVSFIFMGIRLLPETELVKIAQREGVLSPNQKFLEPVYYLSPLLDKTWLEETLTKAFANIRHCIFPPDAMDNSIEFLHNMGHIGSLWDMMIEGHERSPRRRQHDR